MRAVKLAPSILTADFGRLADEVRAAEAGGADMLHLDVMDGRFVPNITFGALLVEALRKVTSLPFDLHLMMVEPERLIDQFADVVDTINVHIEVSPHINRTLDAIHRLGKRAGVCINPGTPVAAIEESLVDVDQVMVMTINPGWGGQQMIPRQLEKVAADPPAARRGGLGRGDRDRWRRENPQCRAMRGRRGQRARLREFGVQPGRQRRREPGRVAPGDRAQLSRRTDPARGGHREMP